MPHYLDEMLYRRRLPHVFETTRPVFLTWRLHGSLPAGRYFPGGKMDSGAVFVAMDRLLDEARAGPVYLAQPALANLIVDALHYNAQSLGHYWLHAFAVMPNHVHVLLTPNIPLPRLTKSLKGITAKGANESLGTTGRPFWHEESFDRDVRNMQELDRIRGYIENNPVRAGLVKEASQFVWSSAGWAARGSPADGGVRLPGAV